MTRFQRYVWILLLGVVFGCPQSLITTGFAQDRMAVPIEESLFEEDEDVDGDADLAIALGDTPLGKGAADSKPKADLDTLLKRIESLEKAEKKRLDTAQKAKDDEAKKADEWQDMSTDKWNIRMGGHIQMDLISWPDSSPSIPNAYNYFEFRRLRLVADGTGYGVYDFRFQMTLEPESVGESPVGLVISPDVKDAYFSINEVPFFGRLRIGNFFVPFSIEQVTNDTNTVFLERSIPSQGVFSPDREVGVAAYNRTDDLSVTWTYGAFIDSISEGLKERIDNNQGFRLSGRATWVPYFDEPTNGRYMFYTGLGVLYTNDQDERVRFRARPQIKEGPRIIDSGQLQASAYTTGNLEGALVWGPFSVQSEAFLSTVQMLKEDSKLVGGAYVQTSYFLTGENRNFERFGQHGAQFGRFVPYSHVFFTRSGSGLGAWELKTRWSNLNLNSVNKGTYNDLTVGCNWYWSDRVRIMFDWIHPVTSADAIFGSTKSDILGFRFDFNW